MADVVLETTIPDAHAAQVLNAFTTLAGLGIELSAIGHTYHAHHSFTIASKDVAETNKDFGERFTKELLRAAVRLVDLKEDEDRYNSAVAAVPPAEQDFNDDIIT